MEMRIDLLYDVKMEGFSFYWFLVNEERIMYLATIDKNVEQVDTQVDRW